MSETPLNAAEQQEANRARLQREIAEGDAWVATHAAHLGRRKDFPATFLGNDMYALRCPCGAERIF